MLRRVLLPAAVLLPKLVALALLGTPPPDPGGGDEGGGETGVAGRAGAREEAAATAASVSLPGRLGDEALHAAAVSWGGASWAARARGGLCARASDESADTVAAGGGGGVGVGREATGAWPMGGGGGVRRWVGCARAWVGATGAGPIECVQKFSSSPFSTMTVPPTCLTISSRVALPLEGSLAPGDEPDTPEAARARQLVSVSAPRWAPEVRPGDDEVA